MTIGKRNIVVKQLPSSFDPCQNAHFLEEVESSLAQRRPSLVLDCSRLQELDETAIHLMLHCLEAALKRNGDVKLAGLPSAVEGAFSAAQLGRLFDVYGTTAEAVASFYLAPAASAAPAATVDSLQAVSIA
ncbi:MAG: STAS domain-containing protein [Acidobacteriaceae bacterium]